jgi:hypothetical protein
MALVVPVAALGFLSRFRMGSLWRQPRRRVIGRRVKVRLPVYRRFLGGHVDRFGIVCLSGVFIARPCRALADLHVNGEERYRGGAAPATPRRFRYAL